MSQLDEALHLEALFQMFRRAHGIGDGHVHREKFLRIMKVEAQIAGEIEERRKIVIVSH